MLKNTVRINTVFRTTEALNRGVSYKVTAGIPDD